MSRILVLNGPNLSRLGAREPEVYGHLDFGAVRAAIDSHVSQWPGVTADVRQTDDEAELIGWLHEAVDSRSAVVINPAAFTHYSYAVRDAVAHVTTSGLTVVEVHLTNPYARERFRHTSVVAPVATGVIAGFGVESYLLALDAVRSRLAAAST